MPAATMPEPVAELDGSTDAERRRDHAGAERLARTYAGETLAPGADRRRAARHEHRLMAESTIFLIDDRGEPVGAIPKPKMITGIIVVPRFGKLTHPDDRHELDLRQPKFENRRWALVPIPETIEPIPEPIERDLKREIGRHAAADL
jgi:hypothetical protein